MADQDRARVAFGDFVRTEIAALTRTAFLLTGDRHLAEDLVQVALGRLVLRQALARLAARQRAVLVLRYFEDRTEVETARLLGCSVGTVNQV